MKPPYHDNLSLHTVHRVTIFFQKQLDCWALKIIGYWLVFTRGQSLLINLCKSLWEIRNLVCLSQIPLEKEKSRTLNVGVIYPSGKITKATIRSVPGKPQINYIILPKTSNYFDFSSAGRMAYQLPKANLCLYHVLYESRWNCRISWKIELLIKENEY